VYVRIDYSRDSPTPADQIKDAIFRATQAAGAWTQTGVAVGGESLWEFLHHRDDILRDASGKTLVPLLIFDQFEEIFTWRRKRLWPAARVAVHRRPRRPVENRAEVARSRIDADGGRRAVRLRAGRLPIRPLPKTSSTWD
jgi:hypothetical protein